LDNAALLLIYINFLCVVMAQTKKMKRILVVFALTTAVMFLVFRFAGWRAEATLLPRFCNNPQATIGYVRKILVDDSPAGDEKHRPYIIAAKLIFLVPQGADEPQDTYLNRLRAKIDASCGQRY
jgi:hypothetical protein